MLGLALALVAVVGFVAFSHPRTLGVVLVWTVVGIAVAVVVGLFAELGGKD